MSKKHKSTEHLNRFVLPKIKRVKRIIIGGKRQAGAYYPMAREIHISIEDRWDSKNEFDTLIHEALHCIFPSMAERRVSQSANKLTAILWKQKYRRATR